MVHSSNISTIETHAGAKVVTVEAAEPVVVGAVDPPPVADVCCAILLGEEAGEGIDVEAAGGGELKREDCAVADGSDSAVTDPPPPELPPEFPRQICGEFSQAE